VSAEQVAERLGHILHHEEISRPCRWYLLKSAVSGVFDEQEARDQGDIDEDHICCILVRAICTREPVIALESRSYDKRHPYFSQLLDKSPLKWAIGEPREPGFPAVVKLMLQSLRWGFEAVFDPGQVEADIRKEIGERALQNIEEEIRQELEKKKRQEAEEKMHQTLSAMRQHSSDWVIDAIKCSNFKSVKYLLDFCPSSANHINVGTKLLDMVAGMVAGIKPPEVFEIIHVVLEKAPALRNRHFLTRAINTGDPDVVKPWFHPEVLTPEAVVKVISGNHLKIWELDMFKEECVKQPNSHNFLHLAVKHCCLEMVRYLAEYTSGAFEPDRYGYYALKYNTDENAVELGVETSFQGNSETKPIVIEEQPSGQPNSEFLKPPPSSRPGSSTMSVMTDFSGYNNSQSDSDASPIHPEDEEAKMKEVQEAAAKRREHRKEIRDIIVTHIIRHRDSEEIYDIMQKSKGSINPSSCSASGKLT
jgi:hypothetical protein